MVRAMMKGKVQKKVKKKLTSVSFASTHYTLEKLTILLFFSKRTWKILKNVQNAKEKNISLSNVICGSFSPSFFTFPLCNFRYPNPSDRLIFVKVRAKEGHFFGQKYEQNSSFCD